MAAEKLPDRDWLVLLRAAGSHNISEIAVWTAGDVCYYIMLMRAVELRCCKLASETARLAQ